MNKKVSEIMKGVYIPKRQENDWGGTEPEERERIIISEDPQLDGGYIILNRVLNEALHRAAKGKGKQRHATDEPFERQWIIQGAQIHGYGSLLFQAEKKIREHYRLSPHDGVNELLDAIVYIAGAIIAIRKEHENDPEVTGNEEAIL